MGKGNADDEGAVGVPTKVRCNATVQQTGRGAIEVRRKCGRLWKCDGLRMRHCRRCPRRRVAPSGVRVHPGVRHRTNGCRRRMCRSDRYGEGGSSRHHRRRRESRGPVADPEAGQSSVTINPCVCSCTSFEPTGLSRRESRRSEGRKILLAGKFSKPRRQFRSRVLISPTIRPGSRCHGGS